MPNGDIIRDFPFEINRRAVLRIQGYRPSSKVSAKVEEMLDEAVARVMSLARPRAVWKVEKVEELTAHGVRASGGMEIASHQVARLLKGCMEIVLFAVTIGEEAEKRAAELVEQGDAAEGLMMDCVASEAVEGCLGHLGKMVQTKAHRRGLHMTPRFSPGYGDWTVERQKDLFMALNPERIGITLTESCMMIPRKSVTAILGLGPLKAIRTGASPCKKCAKSDHD